MPFSVEQIRRALARHTPQDITRDEVSAEAAVALVLAGADGDLALCAIRRAEFPGDPWSGHMALPGGRASPEDPSPRDVAERETFEEVGLRLSGEHWIGPLSDMLVRLGGSGPSMALSEFVYYLGEERPDFLISDEVAEAFWIPLSHLWDPANASRLEWQRQGAKALYPAIRYGEHSIWGITFRVLTLFSDVLDAPLPYLEEVPGPGRGLG